ncbi:MAG: nucleotidyltransferase family protein [Pseudomonadota bacterium]
MSDLTIVIPAAGRSSRMRGTDKLMQEIDGVPLLARVVARAVQVAPTRVVLADGQTGRAAALADHAAEIITVDAGQGMAASLVAGTRGLNSAVMILLADMPDITAQDLATLAALWRAGAGPILRAADRDGCPGHPVILPADALPQIARLTGDRGAGDVLKARAKDVVLYPLGPQACLDLDTPEAWAAWRKGT